MMVPVTNKTMNLADCANDWFYDDKYGVWCLEDILYTDKAEVPAFQRLSVFVPAEYMSEPGVINKDGAHGKYTAATAPIVFENNAAGYMEMPHTWLGGPRDMSEKYLEKGMVFVTCGARGRESRNKDGRLCGKSPWTLVDFKTAIRFLRHNAEFIPGRFDRIISVGWSAGGAMSSLIGVTGNNPVYDAYLEANGAFMDERDDVYASQVYCPIVDLEHADLAYEWQFHADKENEGSIAGPAGTMTPFEDALSSKLYDKYIEYFNDLGLKDPVTGEVLEINEDGRSGSGYDYLMKLLEESASKYLNKLEAGLIPDRTCTVSDYITGNYTYEETVIDMPGPDEIADMAGGAPAMPSLGLLMLRPPKGQEFEGPGESLVERQGSDKSGWLTWDGASAHIKDLDTYILNHRGRMKPCTSFDTLGMNSGENQEFGTPDNDYMHFSMDIAPAIAELKEAFPDEYDKYHDAFAAADGDESLAIRKYLINPMNFIGTDEPDSGTQYYRVRVGASDADTAFVISMALALKLAADGKDTDYALVWDQPHCEADYPGEVTDWIDSIV